MTTRRRSSPGPGLQEVVVIAFAASRIARAVSLDEISAPLRERLRGESGQGAATGGRLRRLAADLVDCPVCTGWWSSLLMSIAWPGNHRFRRGLSVAGVQVVLAFAERLLSEEGRLAVREAESADPPRAASELLVSDGVA